MAKSSELEMQSKSAESLKDQRERLTEILSRAKENLAKGEIPVLEWDIEFSKNEKYQKLRSSEQQRLNASSMSEFGEQVMYVSDILICDFH